MEFFRFVKVKTQANNIQNDLTIKNLESLTNLLFVISDQNERQAKIGGIWGDFTLSRMEIKGGVRFSLLECPNALAWTITSGFPPDERAVVIHLTINRQNKDSEFIEEIEEFLDDHTKCLEQIL